MEDHDTKTRILDASEKLFADNGFSAVSLRAIIKEAGVNTASVHYHFGSKDGLVAAVFERRATPVNAERLRLLDNIEAQHPSGVLPLRPVIEAFIRPIALLPRRSEGQRPMFARLMARLIHEPDQMATKIIHDTFHEIFHRFSVAFGRALPNLPPEEIHTRIHFTVGAMAFSISGPHFFADIPPVSARDDVEHLVDNLVGFVEAGMQAPVAGITGGYEK